MREISSLKKTVWILQQLISNVPDVSEGEEALIVNKEVFTKAERVSKGLVVLPPSTQQC